MGKKFAKPNASNINGFYEDIEFKNFNQDYLEDKITTKQLTEGLKKLKNERKEPWGIKDPRICHLLPIYLALFNPVFIRCNRPHKDIIKSMIKWYGWNYEYSKGLVDFREKQIDKHTKGYEVINIDILKDRLGVILDGRLSTN